MRSIAEQYQVDTLIHLAALLSAVAEAKPISLEFERDWAGQCIGSR